MLVTHKNVMPFRVTSTVASLQFGAIAHFPKINRTLVVAVSCVLTALVCVEAGHAQSLYIKQIPASFGKFIKGGGGGTCPLPGGGGNYSVPKFCSTGDTHEELVANYVAAYSQAYAPCNYSAQVDWCVPQATWPADYPNTSPQECGPKTKRFQEAGQCQISGSPFSFTYIKAPQEASCPAGTINTFELCTNQSTGLLEPCGPMQCEVRSEDAMCGWQSGFAGDRHEVSRGH